MNKVNVFWFRRDLRLEDNKGLYHALNSGLPVVPVFIFDTEILESLEEKEDRRVAFIQAALLHLQEQLKKEGSTMDVRYGKPSEVFKRLIHDYDVQTVFTNHDYEPYAIKRDQQIAAQLSSAAIQFQTFKDQVVFEKDEVVKENGGPYSVYTPYSKKWKELLDENSISSFNTKKYFDCFYQQTEKNIPALEEIGFVDHGLMFTKPEIERQLIAHYDKTRDVFSEDGTSRLSVHLRFGTISIRRLVAAAAELNEKFLNELIWREFFMQILWHQPRLIHECCKKNYEGIRWRNNEKEFDRWCNGTTGYPLVDAGMRELNETGFMHNRVRMVTASFLVKHLLIDWRWGEAYFAKKLLDYELSSNNGNWQWVAGCGCDAAPYFRIFNPTEQAKKFDPELKYIRRWIP